MKKVFVLLIALCLFVQSSYITVYPAQGDYPNIFFEDNFGHGNGMWTFTNNYYVMKDGMALMPEFSSGDTLFSQAALSGVSLTRDYEVEFRIRSSGNCNSGIMILGNSSNFAVLLKSTGFSYLPGGNNIYMSHLANFPSGFTFTTSKWIDVKLRVQYDTANSWNKPYLFIKDADAAEYLPVTINYNLPWLGVPNGKVCLRSQSSVTEYDFLRIRTNNDTTCTTTPPTVSSISLLPSTAKTIYKSESFYMTASLAAGDTTRGYYTNWSASPAGIVEISGEDNLKKTIKGVGEGTAVITVEAGGKSKSLSVTVAGSNITNKSAVLTVSGPGSKINPYIFGINHVQAWNIGRTYDFNPQTRIELIRQIFPQSIRGPGGIDGNYFISQTGDLMNKYHSNFESCYGTTSSLFDNLGLIGPGGVPRESDYPPLTYQEIFKMANSYGVPYIYVMNIFSQTPTEIVDIITEIKKWYAGSVMIEMGNEAYDLNGLYGSETGVNAYIARCKEVNAAVKAVYPEVKTGIVIVGADIKERANSTRLNNWNNFIAASKSENYYDAVIPHIYDPINKSSYTESEMMKHLYAYNKNVNTILSTEAANAFGGKEYWITEWGALPNYLLNEDDRAERARLQSSKSPAFAIACMERMMDMIKSGFVKIASYFSADESQGFGLIQGETRLPQYYAFQKMGELLSQYQYSYNINPSSVGTYQQTIGMGSGKTVTLNEVEAWGLGTNEGIRAVVISNHTRGNMTVFITGYLLSKVWSYGGVDNIFPNYMNSGQTLWTGVPKTIPLPNTVREAKSGTVTLEPYSIAVVELESSDSQEARLVLPEAGEGCRLTSLEIAFDKDMDMTTLKPDTIKLYKTATDEEITYDALNSIPGKRSYTIALYDALESNTAYHVVIGSDVVSESGLPAGGGSPLAFTTLPYTEYGTDTDVVAGLESMSQHLAVGSKINLWFSPNVNVSTLTEDNIKLKNLNTNTYISYMPAVTGSRYIISPDQELNYETSYKIEIGDGVRNTEGKSMDRCREFEFKTAGIFDIYSYVFAREGALSATGRAVVRNNSSTALNVNLFVAKYRSTSLSGLSMENARIKPGETKQVSKTIFMEEDEFEGKSMLWNTVNQSPLIGAIKIGEEINDSNLTQ